MRTNEQYSELLLYSKGVPVKRNLGICNSYCISMELLIKKEIYFSILWNGNRMHYRTKNPTKMLALSKFNPHQIYVFQSF